MRTVAFFSLRSHASICAPILSRRCRVCCDDVCRATLPLVPIAAAFCKDACHAAFSVSIYRSDWDDVAAGDDRAGRAGIIGGRYLGVGWGDGYHLRTCLPAEAPSRSSFARGDCPAIPRGRRRAGVPWLEDPPPSRNDSDSRAAAARYNHDIPSAWLVALPPARARVRRSPHHHGRQSCGSR